MLSVMCSLSVFLGLSQNVYDFTGKYRTVKKEKLSVIKSLNNLIRDYPSNWITSYNSVEITSTNKGIVKKAVGQNNILTPEQKENLTGADVFTHITIKVKYIYKNPYTGIAENNTMDVTFYVAPDNNAQFEGGVMQMRDFLKKYILGNVNDTIPKRLGMVVVQFTVDEDGQVIHSKVSQSCGDLFTDMRLLQAVNKMPKWKPAEHKGEKMKQQFQFSFGGC